MSDANKGLDEAPPRTLPVLDKDNEAYWTGGARGELLIYRCGECGYYVHLPVGFCPKCESGNVTPQPVSGHGHVRSFAVNYRKWVPGLPDKYVLALVAIDEQDDVQLPCNIINCDPESVTMGMRVQVTFLQQDDVWIPFFEPEA